MKKILFLITGLGVGGAERQVTDLATSLKKDGHDITICYLKGEALIRPMQDEITLIKADFDKSPALGFLKLISIIKKIKPDVVHSHMIHANILTRLARIFTKIPLLVSTAHSKNEGGWLRMRAYQFTDFLTDITTNVSHEATEEFIRLKSTPRNKIITIYNGIDTKKFSPNINVREEYRNLLNISDEKLFLAVGRLVDAKDYPNMLHSIKEVYKKEKNIKLFIVGDGPLRKDLEIMTDSLGIKKIVHFLGIRKDVENLMNAADYFLLSSAWEGFGLVVAEAMATEKIVIATDSGGVAEVVGDKGFIVPPSDSIALSEAIIQAINMKDDDSMNLKSEARNRIINNFSIESAKKNYLKIYYKQI